MTKNKFKERILSITAQRINEWLKMPEFPNYVKITRLIALSKTESKFPKFGDIRTIVILPLI